MSVNEDQSNNKINCSKMKSPIYFSPYAHKKKVIGNLYTEPRKIPITDSTSKNKTKPKISNPIISKNIINIQPQECFRKSQKFLSEMNTEKSHQNKKNMPQSYKKINSKLYLKKNVIPNLSSFNEINSNNTCTTQLGTNIKTNTNAELNNSVNSKYYKSRVTNMKFNMGKNNSNNYMSMKESFHNLKKSAGSATELFGNNYIKKTKTKTRTCSDLNNINPIGYILSTAQTSNNNSSNLNNSNNNNKLYLSPRTPAQKIIFLKNDKNKKDKYFNQNINKDSLKVIQTQTNEPINNLEDKSKNGVQYLLRNTYNNVKIFPTTFLNNKIIYQTENNINNPNLKSSSNLNINNNNLNKKEKVGINIDEKNNKANYEKSQSVEEVHFLYVSTIQNGKQLILKWDKCNS